MWKRLFVMTLIAINASATPRRTVTTASTLSIAFVDVAGGDGRLAAVDRDAWLDVQTMAKRGGARTRAARVRRQIGIRIVRSDGTAWGTARVEARLESTDGREKVWIDGQPLTAVPLVVDAHAAVGAVTVHRIEIEVPESMPAGAISASIGWDVTTE